LEDKSKYFTDEWGDDALKNDDADEDGDGEEEVDADDKGEEEGEVAGEEDSGDVDTAEARTAISGSEKIVLEFVTMNSMPATNFSSSSSLSMLLCLTSRSR
jgi:hypothetical protein